MKIAAAIVGAALLGSVSPARLPVAAMSVESARQVEIVGVDYAFKLPATLPPGLTTLHFRNDGQHRHEFNIFLLKRGATIDQVIQAEKEKRSVAEYLEAPVGVLFAGKGKKSEATLTTNLVPGGVYGIQCIMRDSSNAAPHYEMGMFGSVKISEGDPTKAAPKVDSVVAVDYAYIKYPKELSAGLHSLAFRNAGKQRHEMVVALLKPGASVDSVIALDKRGDDPRSLIDMSHGLGLLHSRPGETGVGILDIDFLPGREYLITCTFQDNPKSPPHFMLGMDAAIRVHTQ